MSLVITKKCLLCGGIVPGYSDGHGFSFGSCEDCSNLVNVSEPENRTKRISESDETQRQPEHYCDQIKIGDE